MITPEILVNSFETYRKGDKKFCKLASVSDQEDVYHMNLGFWIEVIRNDSILVALVRFESFSKIPSQVKFFRKKQLENFLEEARQYISSDLEKIVCAEDSDNEDKIVA